MANRPFSHGRNRLRLTTTTFLAGFGLIGLPGLAHAGTLPAGGSVAAGSASIASSGANTVITQSSQNAVINWQSFSVGQGNTVTFNDPNAQSATLNRVTGSATSVIAGQIVSNGAVYLVNPNGIAITSSGAVQTGGGFVASTLGIADADFMAGRLNFAGNGASQTVSNAGKIIAGQGAYVALLGGAVSNAGTITVPLGRVGLGSGEQVALDLNGSGFMQVAVPTALVTGSHALIDNSGAIVVSGGRVTLSAAAVKNAVRNIINVSGSINADSAVGDGGTITLIGGADTADMAGTVTVSGTLSARATGLTGNGGTVETSGATVDFTGLKVDTSSLGGKTGTWVVDPEGLIVDAAAAATISSNLATTDVFLSTDGNTPVGPGTPITDPYAGASVPVIGALYINAPINWTSKNTLQIVSASDIYITGAINGPNGGLFFGDSSSVVRPRVITDSAAVNVGIFRLEGENWVQNMAVLPSFFATDFQIEQVFSIGVTFLRVNGGNGTTATPYKIADIYGLQGIGGVQGSPGSLNITGPALNSASYVLVNNIDASVTSTWNGGAGFSPIGTISTGFSSLSEGFTGVLDGQGHTISGLVINNSAYAEAGLFGQLSTNAIVANLTISGASVTDLATSPNYNFASVGVLAGSAYAATISNVHTSGSVAGATNTGGLLGDASGTTITGSSSSASVTGLNAGGLVGITETSNVQVSQSYATGTVFGVSMAGGLIGESAGSVTQSYATGYVSGGNEVGGLVGENAGTISQSYASGTVDGPRSASIVGGLVGKNDYNNTISYSYATGEVLADMAPQFSGIVAAGGLVGSNYGSINESYATGAINVNGTDVGGLVGLCSGCSVTNSYWDSYSTGQAYALGDGYAPPSVYAVTSDPAQSRAANYAYNSGAYAAFTPADWTFFNGQTRPFGAWEAASTTDASGSLIITNSHQLQLINTNLAGSYVLGNSIDLTETGAVQAGSPGTYSGMWSSAGFVPIGTDGASNVLTGASGPGFQGSFNGNGYTISDLTINRPFANYVGLFGQIGPLSGFTTGATVENLNLVSANVTGNQWVGGVIGYIPGPFNTVANINFSGNVTGGTEASYVGGVIGATYDGSTTESNLTSSGTVTGGDDVGGLIGFDGATLFYSSSSSNVSGSEYVGGLIGRGLYVSVDELGLFGVFATGTVTGTQFVGGLAGSYAGAIDYAYSSGAVSVAAGAQGSYIGGLAGGLGSTGQFTVQNSYSTSAINAPNSTDVGGIGGNIYNINLKTTYYAGSINAPGSTNVGGLAGVIQYGSFYSSYWDTTVSGLSAAQGFGANGGASVNENAGLTTTQMQDYGNAGTTSYVGWDFGGTWSPPTLAGQGAQTAGYYPQLYALTPVVVGALGAQTGTYGSLPTTLGTRTGGGPEDYALGLAGDTLPNVTFGSSAATNISNVTTPGSGYAITATGGTTTSADGVIYRVISFGSGTLAINPAPLTITYTANAAQSVYGTVPLSPTGSYSETGLVNGDALDGSATFAQTATNLSNVGSYAVTGSGLSASSNYTLTSLQAAGNATALTINPAALTITYTANAAQSIYGTTPTVLTGSYGETGLVNGDTLGGSASFTTTATGTSNVGSYGVTGAGLIASNNYTLSAVQTAGNATALTVNPASLTVTYTANGAQSIYGTTPTGLTGSYGETGLVNGDALVGSASFTTTATGLSNVGSYGITGSGLTASSNYTLSSIQAAGNATALTITPAALTITYTANGAQSIYGTTPTGLTGSYGETGLVNGDALVGSAGFTTTATGLSNVGSYGVTGAGLTASSNYTLSSIQAAGNATALTINPALLTITYTANAAQSIYGTTPAGLTGTFGETGLVNGDALGGSAGFTTTATGTSNVGSYGIVGSGLTASSNYTLSSIQAAGNASALMISPAALLITYTAGAAQSTYGTTPSGLTGTYGETGLVNGDALGGSASFTTAATGASNVGSYGVTGSGLTASSNYALSSIQAAGNATALTIKPASLTITYTANPLQSIYGTTPASPTGSYGETGLVNGDALSGNASFATAVTSTSNVGSYGVTGSGLGASSNYMVSSVQAAGNATALTVTPAALTVTYTANSAQSVYGTTPTGLTGTYTDTGLVNGDKLGGSASFTTAATGASNVGSYGITGAGLSASSNYTLSSIQAAGNATALTITPAALTITYTANTTQGIYGTTPSGLSGSYTDTGLVNGDKLGGSASFTTTATSASAVGTYGVTGAGLTASSNYSLSVIQAAGNATALTIAKRVSQSLASFVPYPALYSTALDVTPCTPGAISQDMRAHGKVVITGANSGGGCN